jgi:diketogulonate reductase-like aldo/keto reductase
MRKVSLPSGERVPVLGQGTWYMGDDPRRRGLEAASLARGLDLGLTLIDTAEMYGEGGAERAVGDAIAGRRDEVFLVSKVYPHNAGRKAALAACARSLERLRTDRIDLYLLHWRGGVPLAETVEAFLELQEEGRIRHWGVSNLDADDMAELEAVAGGAGCACNQVLYNLDRRGIEWDLLPWCRERGIPVMAYSPLEQGRLARHKGLAALAARLGVPPLRLALAWVLRQEGVIAIPKAIRPEHQDENLKALALEPDAATLAELDALFPPPTGPRPLAML